MAGRADSVMAQDFLTDVDAPALLGRLKEAVYRGRIRMSTFFEDHDRLRTGLVTEGKFRTAIEASGIAKLTEMEMRALSALWFSRIWGPIRHDDAVMMMSSEKSLRSSSVPSSRHA